MKKTLSLLAIAWVMVLFSACDDDNDGPQIVNPDPKDQWSETKRGDNQSIRAYPDIFANYWEYTYSYAENPNIGLRLTGHFPKARFFNFTVYNDITQINQSGIEDVDITPDQGSVNPYVTEMEDYGKNAYTIHIIPSSTPEALRASLSNICEFPDTLEMVSVFMRLYLAEQYSGEEHGGVDMPAIQAFDVTTGKEVAFPKHQPCNIENIPDVPSANFSDVQKALPFMRAPLSLFYPNTPAEYLFTRLKLNADTVALFSFIPPVAPTKVSEYPTAEVRYWSVCLGSSNTLSYESIYDMEMPDRDANGFVTILIADVNSPKLKEIQEKAKGVKGTYVMTWNRKDHGDGILALYRNMVIHKDYPHSMRELMESIPMSAANGDMTDFKPMKMIAILAMGNWGPQGYKFSEDDYLSDTFDYSKIRRMQ